MPIYNNRKRKKPSLKQRKKRNRKFWCKRNLKKRHKKVPDHEKPSSWIPISMIFLKSHNRNKRKVIIRNKANHSQNFLRIVKAVFLQLRNSMKMIHYSMKIALHHLVLKITIFLKRNLKKLYKKREYQTSKIQLI